MWKKMSIRLLFLLAKAILVVQQVALAASYRLVHWLSAGRALFGSAGRGV